MKPGFQTTGKYKLSKFTGHIGQADLRKIENLFSESFSKTENSYTISIKSNKTNSVIFIEIIPEENSLYLISVYTNNTHLQLQSCTNLIISEMLEEAVFVSETNDMVSGLIISKQGDCSLYSNVDKKLLSSDFSGLNSEKLLAAMALSITETIN